MRRITNEIEVPPGGWWYVEVDSGYKMVARSPSLLREKILRHRKANGYDLTDGWWERVQDEICNRPAMERFWVGSETIEPEIDGIQMIRVFRRLRDQILAGGCAKVSMLEAIKRAEICAVCPHNCANLKVNKNYYPLERWLRDCLSPADKTGHDAWIDFCAKDFWMLELKVWMTKESIRAITDTNIEYPSHCWMKKL